MYADFELSFAFRKGQVLFSLFRDGTTLATHRCNWGEINPRLTGLVRHTEAIDVETEDAESLVSDWVALIALAIGEGACRKIAETLPARLTISVRESVPPSYHDLFRVAPWEIAIPRIAGLSDSTVERNLLDDGQVVVVDVRIAEAGKGAESVGGMENVPASMDFKPDQDDANADGTIFPVWFGSNRELYQKGDKVFERPNSAPSPEVKFGRCDVWIPKSHRRGEQKSPWYRPDRWFADETLQIRNTMLLKELVPDIRLEISPEATTNHLLFIHGFNNSFQDAILRAAQVGFDLGIDGATLAFSWPSRNLLPFISRYSGDGDTIIASRKALAVMAERIADLNGTLHIVAHSMGNRALALSWQQLFETIRKSNTLKVGQVVFAAPDVFQSAFKDDTEGIHEFCERATLYANCCMFHDGCIATNRSSRSVTGSRPFVILG